MAVPTGDAKLVPFATNFDEKLQSDGTTVYHIAAPAVTAFTTLRKLYTDAVAALVTARTNGVRSTPLVQARATARANMLPSLRSLYATISADLTISDSAKTEIGVHVAGPRTRRNAPTATPRFDITSIENNVVSFLAHGETGKRSLAPEATGVTIFSFVGTTPPPTAEGWTWHGNQSRANGQIAFDATIVGPAWICGVFFNDRGQGPASAPVRVTLAGGNAVPKGSDAMKLAA